MSAPQVRRKQKLWDFGGEEKSGKVLGSCCNMRQASQDFNTFGGCKKGWGRASFQAATIWANRLAPLSEVGRNYSQ